MKLKFHIPDFATHWQLNLNLIDMLKEHPEYFYDGVEIASCFGCFPPALWNGGRALFGYTMRERINATIKLFNDRSVPLRFTFTNPTITERDLKDAFCNDICKAADNGFNEIICNSPILEDYIRSTYPNYPLVSTTCKGIKDLDALIAELDKGYKLVVLDYNWNNDFDKLAQIPEKYRERCEVLINPYCIPNCPNRSKHYQFLGELQRKASKTLPGTIQPAITTAEMKFAADNCANTIRNFYQLSQYSTFVPRENLAKYMELGFNNFKIEGRLLNMISVAESYVYYMVKPEYRDMVRLELLITPRTELAAPQRRTV